MLTAKQGERGRGSMTTGEAHVIFISSITAPDWLMVMSSALTNTTSRRSADSARSTHITLTSIEKPSVFLLAGAPALTMTREEDATSVSKEGGEGVSKVSTAEALLPTSTTRIRGEKKAEGLLVFAPILMLVGSIADTGRMKRGKHVTDTGADAHKADDGACARGKTHA
jgi:hypothetical protein